MKLFKHQRAAVTWLKKRPKAILAYDMGLGKTAVAIKTMIRGEKTLVVCPASLKFNWLNELRIWAPDAKVQVVSCHKSVIDKKADIVIISYAVTGKILRQKDSNGKTRSKVVDSHDYSVFDYVVLDESQLIKSTKTLRSKVCCRIVSRLPRALLLTGTPMERPIDLYTSLRSIGAISYTKDQFGHRYCDAKLISIGRGREAWVYRGLKNPEALRAEIKGYLLRETKESVDMQLTERNIRVVKLDLPVDVREKQFSFEDIKKSETPLGIIGLSELIHDQAHRKLPECISHIKMRLSAVHKVVVIAYHRDIIEELNEKLASFNSITLDGRDTAKQKHAKVKQFQEDKSARVMIGQITAMGVGINLTAAKHVIFVEASWSYTAIQQAIDRCHRIGQVNDVTAELLTINKSIDEQMLHVSLTKKQFINKVIEKED